MSARQPCEPAMSKRKLKRPSEGDRFSSLEATVAQLTNKIQKMSGQSPSESVSPTVWSGPSATTMSSVDAPVYGPMFGNSGIDELIASGIITQQKAIDLFQDFVDALKYGLSNLILPSNVSFWDLYSRRPILLQAILMAASGDDSVLYPIMLEKLKARLLHEYFTNFTRTLDLMQAFLLSCEFFTPEDQPTKWMSQTWAPLALEVAMDINLFDDAKQPDELVPLETERSVLWVYSMHAWHAIGNKRLPRRIIWTTRHEQCRLRLMNGCMLDRVLANCSLFPKHFLDFMDFERCCTKSILQANLQRVALLEEACSATPHPVLKNGINAMIISLHETFTRKAERTIENAAQIQMSVAEVKRAAIGSTNVIESLTGPPIGVPTFFLFKPLHTILICCKVFRNANIDEDAWALEYADRVEQSLLRISRKGSVMAATAFAKPGEIIRYFRECPANEDLTTSIAKFWAQKEVVDTSVDFQLFAE